jgi:hypothetical protein
VEVVLPDIAARWAMVERHGETVMGRMTAILVADGAAWDPLSFTLGASRCRTRTPRPAGSGDRLVTLDGPDGTWALVWQTAWDTHEDAIEFFRCGLRRVRRSAPPRRCCRPRTSRGPPGRSRDRGAGER